MNAFSKRSRSKRLSNDDPSISALRENWREMPESKLVATLRRLQKRGASVREIAAAIGLNESSIRWHLSSDRRKSQRIRQSLTKNPAIPHAGANSSASTSSRELSSAAPRASSASSRARLPEEETLVKLLEFLRDFATWSRKNQLYAGFVFQLALEDITHGHVRPSPLTRPSPDVGNETDFVGWLLHQLFSITTDRHLIVQSLETMAWNPVQKAGRAMSTVD